MTYAALTALAMVVARLPRGVRTWLGSALGYLVGSLLRVRRALVEAAMTRAGVDDPPAVATRMYQRLGEGVFELLWLAGAKEATRGEAIAQVSIDEDDVRALETACDAGPVVLLASHTGNWELAAAAAGRLLSRRGRRLVVVAKRMHARGVDAFVAELRQRLGVHVVPPQGALGAASRALAAGDVVVMPIDQVPDRARHGLPLRFLREMALVDRAPATVAWRAKATVLVVAAERSGSGERVRVLATVAPPACGSAPRAWIEATTARATATLEAFVMRSPASWLWMHRRWRAPRRELDHGGRLVARREPG
ncbi:MAG: Lipid biosynthesis lauroyl acyltransferase [Labilithrix sp.]|nr:Lipid biosynthesis lauroyl acyltransferase [Labilithrix sp.]